MPGLHISVQLGVTLVLEQNYRLQALPACPAHNTLRGMTRGQANGGQKAITTAPTRAASTVLLHVEQFFSLQPNRKVRGNPPKSNVQTIQRIYTPRNHVTKYPTLAQEQRSSRRVRLCIRGGPVVEASAVLGVEHLDPVAVRVADESEALHGSRVRLLLKLHAQLLEALAGCVHVRHLRGTPLRYTRSR